MGECADILHEETFQYLVTAPRRQSKHHLADIELFPRVDALVSRGHTPRQAAKLVLPDISGGNMVKDKSKVERIVNGYTVWKAKA